MTMSIWQFVALLAAFAVFAGLTYWRGYRNGYRAAMRPVAGTLHPFMYQGGGGGVGVVAGSAGGRGVAAGKASNIPDYEDGSPRP